MSCKALKLNSCEIKGSTFQGRKFDFGTRDISDDIFTAKVRLRNSELTTITGSKTGSEVYFPFTSIENYKADRYTIEYWANFDGIGEEMIAIEDFVISLVPCNGCSEGTQTNFTLNFPEEVINYEVSYSIVQVGDYRMTDLEIKEAYERNDNTNAFTDSEKTKLSGLSNYNDTAIINSLQNKVDKVSGKGLSTNDYTTEEKDKLAGIDSNKFKGKFSTLAALQLITGESGAYAYVGGELEDDQSYIWDDDVNEWVLSISIPTAETPASIKTKYESNPDTNTFTDSEKSKLNTLSAKNYKEIRGYLYQPGDDSDPQLAIVGGLEIGFQSFLRVAVGEYVLTLSNPVNLDNVFFQNSLSYFENNHPMFTFGEMFLIFSKTESTSTELKFIALPTALSYPNSRVDGANNAPFYLYILD